MTLLLENKELLKYFAAFEGIYYCNYFMVNICPGGRDIGSSDVEWGI